MVGRHSAVKPCLWLKKSLRSEGACYKSRFYGISSHRCVQMTPSLRCTHRCVFCWRPIELPIPEHGWDAPAQIVEGCLAEHMRLLSGYGGATTTDLQKLDEAKRPKHVAISLAGEPTLYPLLPELIEAFHEQGMTTFVVTNGTNPEMLTKIKPTQLYISLNAPDEEMHKKVCNPVGDTWSDINKSLELMNNINTRTAIRVTLVNGLNMVSPEGYAKLIERAEPDYVEAKSYMHLGFSRRRLPRSAMPSHEIVRSFAERLADELGYKIADEAEISRVVLLSKNGKVERIK
ncbi:MAG: 4-demethylwyosine synthase TYW1 [Methanocellales archaeon]|nr:4-demethylwyosine synthase TYW1 [Methanocellales archaeon]